METGCAKVGAAQKGDAKTEEGTRWVGTLQRRATQKKTQGGRRHGIYGD